jgi:outer membrane usher protein FimD/PapC
MKNLLRRRRPSAAMIVAVIALVVALGGTAVAAKKLGLGSLSNGAKNKTIGVGKLTYVSTQQTYQSNTQPNDGYVLTATCPSGTHPLGGGVKLVSPSYTDSNYFLAQEYLSTNGYTAKFFAGTNTTPNTVQVTVSCAVSRAVSGAPPAV